jgi:hypothetical protein
MFDLGKVIKQGSFTNSECTKGTLTLYENGYLAKCMKPRGWSWQIAWIGIEIFRVHRGIAGGKGIWINNSYYRVDEPEEWIDAIKEALTAKGIKFKLPEQPETYRVVE